MLAAQHASIKKALEALLLAIAKETELIQQDNLARGQLVQAAGVTAMLQTEDDKSQWQWSYQSLRTPVIESDTPEYWGDFNFYSWEDFIAGTNEYPWMPESVSVDEAPF
jgi:hypothetical protein